MMLFRLVVYVCVHTLWLHNCPISLTARLNTMVPQQTIYILVLTVTVLALPSTGTILTIKPRSNTPCPNNLCFTLSEYAQHNPRYFSSSNITLQFLSGNHILASNLIIANIQHLDILGDATSLTSTRIKCTGSNVGFAVRNISEVRVHDITFTDCGISRHIYILHPPSSTATRLQTRINNVQQYYAVLVQSVQHVEVSECVFNHNYGTALAIFNSSVTLSGNNTFSSNCQCSLSPRCFAVCFGGGVYVVASDAKFSGNTTFDRNVGGGLHAFHNSNVSFSGSTTFRGNVAVNGGGIHASHNCHVRFSGTGTISENRATNGGGIYLEGSTIDCSGKITIKNNKAKQHGGGIFLTRSGNFRWLIMMIGNYNYGGEFGQSNIRSSHFSGTSTISDNTAERGGGIMSINSNIDMSGNITVRNNTALLHGGGILSHYNTIDISGNITVTSNTAQQHGGGMHLDNSTIGITGTSAVDVNSAALYGGGIYMSRTHLTLAGINNFTANSAREGGGMYATTNSTLYFDGMNSFDTNRAEVSGGGIWMDNGNLTLNRSNSIVRCTAGYEGGGISIYNVAINLTGNNKFISNAARSGGGISARWSNFSFAKSSHFSNNSAADTGGGISTSFSTLIFGGNNNTFDNNCADLGGGVYMLKSSLNFPGNNYFISNHARQDGGGIYGRENSTVDLSGCNSFQSNEADRGGGLFVEFCKLCLSGRSSFHSNNGMTGGGLYSLHSHLEFSGLYSHFVANSAINAGGGLATVYSTIDLAGNTSFERNFALSGGAMYIEDAEVDLSGTNHFIQDNAHYEGGAIYIRASKVNMSGKNVLEHNSAAMRGGSLFATCATINFTGITMIANSKSPEGAAIHMAYSSIIAEGSTQFWNNLAHYGGAVFSENSNFTFGGSTCGKEQWNVELGSFFMNNTAVRGGAMHLDHQSSIFINPPACMHFKNNTATEYGGAMYVIDIAGTNTCPPLLDLPSRNECFVHVIGKELSQIGRINLTFQGNTARKSGSILYGGMLNKCNCSHSGNCTQHLFNNSNKDEATAHEIAAISSDPVLCFCTGGGSRKCKEEEHINAFPGQKVNVSVIAVDQTGTPILTAIHADLISDEKHNSRVCEAFLQEREGLCTNRSYTITSPNTTSKLLLYPTTVSGNPTPAVLHITFQSCPVGFEQSNFTNKCICDRRLQMFTNTCNIDSQTFLRTSEMSFWVNASYDNDTFEGYVTHPQCPLNYCTKERKQINLNNPDEHCISNRSGLLCGSCKEGFSLILGSSQCKKCSNNYLALLIPFALAGVALVVLLFMLNLTVTQGTLHGLIFYANIVAANYHIFFPPNSNLALRIFMAWLNLDLGIETCFYNGMDAYSKQWLQFVFPLYIWGIVGFLLYISRQSQRMTRLLGTNPVAVLDTLFLLSYTKVLRTVITSLSLTTLHYPNHDSVVWLYDPSISTLKLIPFIFIALVFLIFLLLPYTMLLLVGQWLWTERDCCWLSCWNKHPRLELRLKIILDPYHASYKSECRYWTGLFLLFRCILFLVSAFNISGDKNSANLLAILTVVIVSFVVFGLAGRVYKSWCLNALELSFLLNLSIFTSATYHVSLAKGDQAVIAYISVGIAFLTFVGIVTYHAYLQIKPWTPQHIFCCIKDEDKKSDFNKSEENDNAQNHMHELQAWAKTPPTTTFVELCDLRHPLDLIDTKSMNKRLHFYD